jgi:maltose alpha-D-glucosyltransferase/alpha-amylase
MAETVVSLIDDPLWYKDAVIYELPVKSFFDSNDDGVGDFRGLIKKLDYLQNLGATAVWVLPFYPSPLRDDGYDISDYHNINPAYGTLPVFREFLRQAHQRGLRVITELVLNHTSDQHRWFQKSRSGKPGSAWRNFYVWSRTARKYKDARVIFNDFESSNWAWDTTAKAYFWHRFYSHQPDLNYDHPGVQRAMLGLIDFWLKTGVDGLRLDAVPYLFEREGTNCENLPETHQFLKRLRARVDEKFKNRMLLAEANQWPEDAAAYFGQGDEAQMAFNFPVMPRMFMAVQMEERFPLLDILEPPLPIPDSCQWALFLRNHDELTLEMVTDEERDYMYRVYARDPRAKLNLGIRRRLAPLLGNNRRKIELLNILLFSLPGTPVIYYGDEIGMGDNYYLGDRNGVRTPMQWSADRNAGFSRANPQRLFLPVIIDPEYHYEAVNVENQEGNLSSLLWWMKRVIAMRKKYRAFGRGTIEFVPSPNPKILAFIRKYGEESILVAVNLSRFSQVAELSLPRYRGHVPEDLFSRNNFPSLKESPYVLTLGPYGHYWFRLKKEGEVALERRGEGLPSLILRKSPGDILARGNLEKLAQDILGPYLKTCGWFSGRARTIRTLRLVEAVALPRSAARSFFLIVEVGYTEGLPEMYFLPLSVALGEEAHHLKEVQPQAVVADLAVRDEKGILYDGAFDPDTQRFLLQMSTAGTGRVRGLTGEFVGQPGKNARKIRGEEEPSQASTVLQGEQNNTVLFFGRWLVLKLFRKLEGGINPDVELQQFLSERAGFPHIPSYAGAIEYRQNNAEPVSIGLLQGFVPNEGTAWSFALDNLGHFFESVLSRGTGNGETPYDRPSLFENDGPEVKRHMTELAGEFFSEMIHLLGTRTGELHLALFSRAKDPDFAPEPFSALYQRSVDQSMRSLVFHVYRRLEAVSPGFSPRLKEEAAGIVNCRTEVLEHLARIRQQKISAMKIRIHGDYHLGQVLFTGKDFVIIDFEGEPARALSERKIKRSPLRDVAGMIRSFHYAAYSALLRHHAVRPQDEPVLEPWVKAWYQWVSRVFLRSYFSTVGQAGFLPKRKPELVVLLEAFLLEKAVYELGYELNNRPDWVIIPIKGIRSILQ